MLPSATELRERSRFYREGARDATDTETKRRLSECAFVLAKVAETIERDEQGANANADRLARLIVDALGVVRGPRSNQLYASGMTAAERAIADQRARIKRWRIKAEEVRTVADQFGVPSARESMRRVATNYDQLANDAEAMLEGRPSAPRENAG